MNATDWLEYAITGTVCLTGLAVFPLLLGLVLIGSGPLLAAICKPLIRLIQIPVRLFLAAAFRRQRYPLFGNTHVIVTDTSKAEK